MTVGFSHDIKTSRLLCYYYYYYYYYTYYECPQPVVYTA